MPPLGFIVRVRDHNWLQFVSSGANVAGLADETTATAHRLQYLLPTQALGSLHMHITDGRGATPLLVALDPAAEAQWVHEHVNAEKVAGRTVVLVGTVVCAPRCVRTLSYCIVATPLSGDCLPRGRLRGGGECRVVGMCETWPYPLVFHASPASPRQVNTHPSAGVGAQQATAADGVAHQGLGAAHAAPGYTFAAGQDLGAMVLTAKQPGGLVSPGRGRGRGRGRVGRPPLGQGRGGARGRGRGQGRTAAALAAHSDGGTADITGEVPQLNDDAVDRDMEDDEDIPSEDEDDEDEKPARPRGRPPGSGRGRGRRGRPPGSGRGRRGRPPGRGRGRGRGRSAGTGAGTVGDTDTPPPPAQPHPENEPAADA